MPFRDATAAPSDSALVAAAREGDRWAFRQLVQRHEDQVAATVVGMLGPGAEADDVGQQVFIRFYEALDQFRGEAALGTYLTRIAINLSLNELKRRRRWHRRFLSRDAAEAPLPEPPADGPAAINARERAALVQQAVRQLKPKHRAVVVLRLIDGYSTRETAGILDIAEGTVLSRLARAKDALRTHLRPYFPDLYDE